MNTFRNDEEPKLSEREKEQFLKAMGSNKTRVNRKGEFVVRGEGGMPLEYMLRNVGRKQGQDALDAYQKRLRRKNRDNALEKMMKRLASASKARKAARASQRSLSQSKSGAGSGNCTSAGCGAYD